MLKSRTCPGCGHRMTTAALWRRLMGQLGWQVACPACGRVHDIAVRERVVSTLYYAVAPGLLSAIALSYIAVPAGRLQRGALLLGLFLALAALGSWFAARRLRFGPARGGGAGAS